MKWFYDLRIGQKLVLAFLLVSALTVIVGVQGLSNMGSINEMLDNLYSQETLGISYLKEANINLIYFGRAQNNFLLASTAEDRTKYQQRMDEYENMMKSNIEKARPLLHTEKAKLLLSQFESAWQEFKNVTDEVVNLGNTEDLSAKRESVLLAQGRGREKADIVDTLLSKLARVKEENGKDYFDESGKVYADARLFMIFLILGAVGLGIGLGIFISRLIGKPVRELSDAADRLALGEVDVHVNAETKDELGMLAASFKRMINNIREQASVADKIAQGDLSSEIKAKSEKDILSNALLKVTVSLRDLLNETDRLSRASAEGDLDIFASLNTEKFHGGYKRLLDGFGTTVTTIIKNLRDYETVINKAGKGDLTARMTGDYKGNYKNLQDNVNKFSESIHAVISEVNEAVQATASAANEISS
ncbi:MAG: HAMP domain-containing protein, partial [Ignavibacteria bacterium]|nr:HAMP domain-containing protein [Ignavibacteria bacterium]